MVGARGSVLGQELSWKRALNGWPGRTTYREANALKALAQGLTKKARQRDVLLPLIAHYDICRLCGIPRDQGLIRDAEPLADKTGMSRRTGYDLSIDETPGIVLIDELDLHLHPKWQRRVAADLKRTFPSLQFVCNAWTRDRTSDLVASASSLSRP